MYVQRGAQPVSLSYLGFSNWVHRGLQAAVCIQRKVGSRRQQSARDSEQRGRRALIDGRIDTRLRYWTCRWSKTPGNYLPWPSPLNPIIHKNFYRQRADLKYPEKYSPRDTFAWSAKNEDIRFQATAHQRCCSSHHLLTARLNLRDVERSWT